MFDVVAGMSDRDLEQLVNVASKERLQRMERGAQDAAVGCGSLPISLLTTMKMAEEGTRGAMRGLDTCAVTPAMPLSLDNVVDAFTYHPWSRDQVEAGAQVVEALIAAAKVILRVVPAGADRTVALRKLREARMDANSAITHRGRF